MSKAEKRLERLQNNPTGSTFDDFCACMVSEGFVKDGGAGSHVVYRHPGPPPQTLSVQPKGDGKAKPYQVKQFVAMLDELDNSEVQP